MATGTPVTTVETTDVVAPTPTPVKLLPGQQRAMVGTTEFIANVDDLAVEVGSWCKSNWDRYEHTLLGAFEHVMKQRGKHAMKAAAFDAAFTKFAHEEV